MAVGYLATAQITIDASADVVWDTLTDSDQVPQFMFGSEVVTDWQVGSTIVYRGQWNGKPFEDRGMILESRPGSRLVTTHFSPLTGQPDLPENYHTITYDLEEREGQTTVTLTQDNNATEEEARHSQSNWERMLASLKWVVED